MLLSKEELLKIRGGGLTTTMVNAISRSIDTFLDFGKAIGSAIRRITSGKLCPL